MLGLPISGLSLELRNYAQFQSQLGRAETMTRAMGDSLGVVVSESQRASRVLGTVGIALAGVGVAMSMILVPSVKAAAEFERLTIMGTGVAAAMGISRDALEAERKELNKLDIANDDTAKSLNGLILSHVDFTKASDLATAALDMAAFYGTATATVLDDYSKAVENASTRTLRQYRILASSEAVFDVYGRTIGKVGAKLTEVEKRQAVLNYILTISERIAGAYGAVLNNVEGQLRLLAVRTHEAGESLGTALAPMVVKVLQLANDLLRRFIELPAPIQAAVGVVMALVAALGLLAGAVTLLGPGVKVLSVAFKALPGILTGTSVALATTTGLGAQVGVVLRGAAAKVGVLAARFASLNPVVVAVIATIALLGGAIATNFGGLGDLVRKAVEDVGKSLGAIVVDLKVWGTAAFELIRDYVAKPFQWAERQIRTITGNLSKQNFGFTFDVAGFFLGGARLMASFAVGIIEGVNTYVLPALIGMLESISALLIGASPPREGPLSKIDIGGVKIIQAWLQGMSSVSLDAVQAIAEEVSGKLTRALWLTMDTLFDIETQERQLGKVLWPFEDSLTRIQAAADLIVIPLQRQERVLNRELEIVRAIAEEERRRAEAWLRALERQTAQLQELAAADQARLAVVDHEIFMEELRNRILGRITSAKLITMKSTSRLLTDQVKQEEEAVKRSQAAEKVEKERLDALTTAAEAQMAAIQTQIDRLERLIGLESERVTWTEEELRLQQALQVETRLAALEERRFWEEEERQISHLLEIIGRLPDEAKDKATKATKAALKGTEAIIQDWETEMLDKFQPPDLTPKLDRTAIDDAKRQLAAIFEPVKSALLDTKVLWDKLQTRWKEFEIVVKLKWEEDPKLFMERLGAAFSAWDLRLGQMLSDFMSRTTTSLVKQSNAWAEQALKDFGVWHAQALLDVQAWLAESDAAVAKWYAGVSPVFNYFYKEAVKWLEQTGRDIDDWLDEQDKAIGKWVDNLVKKIGKTIGSWLADQRGKADKWMADLGGSITIWLVSLRASIESQLVLLGTMIALKADEWAVAAAKWVDDAKVAILVKLDELNAAMSRWWDETGIPAALVQGRVLVERIVNGAWEALENEAGRIAGIGSSIVDGIQRGFESGWGRFTDWVNERIRGIIKSIQDAIGMGSPARETTPIGVAMAQGIERGFSQQLNAWVARIQPQMRVAVSGLGGSVRGTEGARSSVINNYYGSTTTQGPSISVAAQYARPQSPGSIRDDVALLLAVAH